MTAWARVPGCVNVGERGERGEIDLYFSVPVTTWPDLSDLYTSILASLFSLKFPGSDVEELVNSLTAQANTTKAGEKFWQLQKAEEEEPCSHCWWCYRPSSEAVEMTAYMVMVHVLRSEPGLAVESVK